MPRDWRQRGAGFREVRQAGLGDVNVFITSVVVSCVVTTVNPTVVIVAAIDGLNIRNVTIITPKLDNVTMITPTLANVTMDGA